jgi:hypothetical protein
MPTHYSVNMSDYSTLKEKEVFGSSWHLFLETNISFPFPQRSSTTVILNIWFFLVKLSAHSEKK